MKPTQTRINHDKYTFCVIKLLERLKNLKTGRVVPYLGLELTMHVLKSQIHLVRRVMVITKNTQFGYKKCG
jgi:hypothetical protein